MESIKEGPPPPDPKAPPPDDGLHLIGETLDETLRIIRHRFDGTEAPIPLPWPTLGRALSGGRGGLWAGVHFLVSNTGVGKTQWCMQAMLHAAQQGTPVAYCGLEMTRHEATTRLLGLHAGVPWAQLFHGRFEGDPHNRGLHKAVQSTAALKQLPLLIDEGTPYGWPYDRLTSVAEKLAERYPDKPALIVLDFLQVVAGRLDAEGTPERLDMRERIQRAAYHARAVARSYKAAVLVVSSTARQNYAELATSEEADALPGRDDESKGDRAQRKKKIPFGDGSPGRFVGLGKESGEIEFSADSVLVLGADGTRSNDDDNGRPVALGLAKVRAPWVRPKLGMVEWVRFTFDGTRFDEAEETPSSRITTDDL